MGKEIVYCSVCGDRIPSADLEKGKAVTILKRNYCKKCAVTVPKNLSEGPGHDATTTPSPRKIRALQLPIADKPSVQAGNRIPFLIAAIVGIIAFLLLIYVLFIKKG